MTNYVNRVNGSTNFFFFAHTAKYVVLNKHCVQVYTYKYKKKNLHPLNTLILLCNVINKYIVCLLKYVI